MMYQTLLGYKLPQVLDNPDKLIPNSWAFCCPEPLTKHPKTRGGILHELQLHHKSRASFQECCRRKHLPIKK